MSQRVRVKICGITRVEDAQAAVAAGADALGFVFYPPSPRHVTVAQAAELVRAVSPFVTTVGLFVDPTPEDVRTVLAQVPLDLLQFHGDEPEAFCVQFGRPWIKALRMRPELDVIAAMAAWPQAQGFLLDAWHPQLAGGTGETFAWDRFPRQSAKPLILAGGLTPDNVAEAVRCCQPYAVDVSGGVEQSKGIKNASLIRAFIEGVSQ